MSTPLLSNRQAVIYGGARRIGHGVATAYAAIDNHMRQLARDHASSGLRVCGTCSPGVDRHDVMARFSVLGRAPRLEEVANAAVFLASDLAAATTGAVLNVSTGVAF